MLLAGSLHDVHVDDDAYSSCSGCLRDVHASSAQVVREMWVEQQQFTFTLYPNTDVDMILKRRCFPVSINSPSRF